MKSGFSQNRTMHFSYTCLLLILADFVFLENIERLIYYSK